MVTLLSCIASLILLLLGMTVIATAQWTGQNPLRGNPKLSKRVMIFARPIMRWESVFEVAIIAFMTLPLLGMLYILMRFTIGVVPLFNVGWFAAGTIVLLWALDNLDVCCRYTACEMWPTTRGRAYPAPIPQLDLTLQSHVEYIYAVNGLRYVGNRIDPHNLYRAPRYHSVIGQDRSALEVLVYYHPEEPEIALLEPGVNWSSAAVPLGLAISFYIVLLLSIPL